MRSIAYTLFLSACMLAGLTSAADPPMPAMAYLFSVNLTGLDPIHYGAGPLGNLTYTAVKEGTFQGPKLNGTYVAGGDWNLVDYQGVYHPDVRETLLTDDGAYIQLYQSGGGPQAGGYGYIHISFVTGSEAYYWLNKVIAIGVLTYISPTHVTVDAWQLEGYAS